MTHRMNEIPEDRDWLLDLLVDNELDDERRRQALAALDAQPDGWRRCALAFLEAQSLGDDLGSLSREAVPHATSPRRAPAGRRNVLMLAASVLLAFGLGVVARDVVPTTGAPVNDGAAVTDAGGRPEADGPHDSAGAAVQENFWDLQPDIPSDVLGALRRTGYSVTRERRHVPLELDDGRRLLLPVKDVYIERMERSEI